MSKRFHELVTTPHAWRIAFSRYFPGAEALNALESDLVSSDQDDTLHAERRLFARLTALASWRSEYILRTRLLRSIARGKPLESPGLSSPGFARSGASTNGSAHVTYNSDLMTLVDRLHATFGIGLKKRLPRLIHGATDVGMSSSSDPKLGKLDTWGFADSLITQQFSDLYPGDSYYGLGAGDIVGVPNVMDVSQTYGMLYAEGHPGGRAYYRSTEEKRGRDLACSMHQAAPELGIASIPRTESFCSVWIAKDSTLPEMSEGLVGMLIGSSQGLVSSYSLGTDSLRDRRLERGELTARWILSPGVPIVGIAVDGNFSEKRYSMGRMWAVVLNALGEVFYLTEVPVRRVSERSFKNERIESEKLAWSVGRTVYWSIVEPTRRKARPDPFNSSGIEGSYMPRSSWHGMGLSKEQVSAETMEINTFLQKKPKDFREICEGWDMRRRLEVDFASSDENQSGETIVVIGCGMDEGQQAEIRRFTRCRLNTVSHEVNTEVRDMPLADGCTTRTSIFGEKTSAFEEHPTWSFRNALLSRCGSGVQHNLKNTDVTEEWRTSLFELSGPKSPQITATTIDSSSFALLATTEDPLLGMIGSSTASSPMSSPLGQMPFPNSPTDVPGQRARLLAVGTKTGTIILWNMRAPNANNTILENTIKPVRIIHTDSPQISCLAMTALYLVHGGNDGLVQAWDPLASTTDPIRTINSRFSSRARRRLVQAEASPAGIGINLFAAGAICLDPDPTVLRGMVSLGSHVRYWSYSSQTADQYKGNKRRLRRSERSSNQGADRFSGSGRGNLKDYIANEKSELEREKRLRRKEDERLSGRYGIDLLGPGATEDEVLAYATMLSEEAAQSDELRRKSVSDASGSETVVEEVVASPPSSSPQEDLDHDMAEAIRLSLEESGGYRASSLTNNDAGASIFAMKHGKKKSPPPSTPPRQGISTNSSTFVQETRSPAAELDDLEFALQLSQAEEESRATGGCRSGKGKERAY